MRNLRKNQRTLWFASFIDASNILDEYGNETLDVEKHYGEPCEIELNISSNVGEESTRVFGDISQYSRVISYVGSSCPLKKKDKVWIGVAATEKANYEVVKVADSLNSWLIALKELV